MNKYTYIGGVCSGIVVMFIKEVEAVAQDNLRF